MCSWKVHLEKSLSWKVFSWKEPFEVGKLEMKLERYVVVGKIRMGVELGWSRRISSTKSLILIPFPNPNP